jgi:hypothetical protein
MLAAVVAVVILTHIHQIIHIVYQLLDQEVQVVVAADQELTLLQHQVLQTPVVAAVVLVLITTLPYTEPTVVPEDQVL